MTRAEMEMVTDGIVSTTKQAIVPLQARIQELAARIVALEAKPSVKFCGVWKADTDYVIGAAVTHHGGLWICKADTRGEPGKDFSCWQLAVKKGSAT